jgi:hypothetical protein
MGMTHFKALKTFAAEWKKIPKVFACRMLEY